MGGEQQLVKFQAGEQTKIAKMVREMQPDNTLTAFKDLSVIINKAIDMLPIKVIPILQQLRVSYSSTRTTIEVGFTSSSGMFSEFIIKSWQVMQHGMNKNDKKTLMDIGKQLNTIFVNDLDVFVESSRAELVQIQSQLLLEATGGKVQNLLDRRNNLETDFLQLSALLKNKSSECGINQGIIDVLELSAIVSKIGIAIRGNETTVDALEWVKSLIKSEAIKLKEHLNDPKKKKEKQHDCPSEGGLLSRLWQKLRNSRIGHMARSAWERFKKLMGLTDSFDETTETPKCSTNQGIEFSGEFTRNMNAVKEEIMTVIFKLKEQILEYKNKIQEFRDLRLEERGSFWIFSWKVRDIYAGNIKKTIEENINRLQERTYFVRDIFENGSILDLVKALLDGKESLPFYKAKQIQLERERKEFQVRFDQVSKEFYAVIEEIDEIYRSTGTVNIESMKMVDELCRAVQSGQESITSAYAIMRIHLSAISIDSDLLVASVSYSLQVLNMIDRYLDTTKIEDLKQVLTLE